MKKSYLILAAVAGLLASCSSEVLVDDQPTRTTTPVAIGFSTFADFATRAESGNLEAYHETFAVYGTKKSTVDVNDPVQYVFGGVPEEENNVMTATAGTTCYWKENTTGAGLNATTGDWRYDNPRYWDRQATYAFIAYAPAAAKLSYFYPAEESEVTALNAAATAKGNFKTTQTFTLTGTNLQGTTATTEPIFVGFTGLSGADTDLMTSELVTENGSGHYVATGHDHADVNLTFKHILAKLNVTIRKYHTLNASTVKVTSVKITGLKDSGTYSELDYSNTGGAAPTITSGWAAETKEDDYTIQYVKAVGSVEDTEILKNWDMTDPTSPVAPKPHYFIESLVIPQELTDDAKLVIKYRITTGSYSEDYTYEVPSFKQVFPNFYDRFSYTLNFTIAPDVITFDAGVSAWDDQPVNYTIPYDPVYDN